MAELKESCGFAYWIHRGDDPDGLCIYYLGQPQEPEELERVYGGYPCSIVYVVVDDWNDELTPWPAKGVSARRPDFGGHGARTLETLTERLVPVAERREGLSPARRAIAGYSLAGLFSIYAFANCDTFQDAASMSGSFWYEGWVDYLAGLKRHKDGSLVYLSLGTAERKAPQKIMRTVQEHTDETARILEGWGARVEKRYGPGGHFDHVEERVRAGLEALVAGCGK